MKEICASQIEGAVCRTLLSSHFSICCDISQSISMATQVEPLDSSAVILQQILENYTIAAQEQIPICQDSGMTLIYAEVGQDAHITGCFEDAVNAGVRRAHREGYLRASVVRDPLFHRDNTGDGTPAILQVRLVPGDQVKITAVAKGFGSENNSCLRMFIPATPLEEIKEYIIQCTLKGAAKSCPPIIVGVGIGGTMDKAAALAKTATFRPVDSPNPDAQYAALEKELLERINASGIGPAGLGGKTTALAVNIETFPTHIASIPVAVNLCCHASRHATVIL